MFDALCPSSTTDTYWRPRHRKKLGCTLSVINIRYTDLTAICTFSVVVCYIWPKLVSMSYLKEIQFWSLRSTAIAYVEYVLAVCEHWKKKLTVNYRGTKCWPFSGSLHKSVCHLGPQEICLLLISLIVYGKPSPTVFPYLDSHVRSQLSVAGSAYVTGRYTEGAHCKGLFTRENSWYSQFMQQLTFIFCQGAASTSLTTDCLGYQWSF